MALWGGRFSQDTSSLFKQLNDSLPFDQALAAQDIQGSIAWSRALRGAQVLTENEQIEIEQALTQLLAQANKGKLNFASSSEEDIHSFVEAALIEKLGDLGRKLHTGRSRNDQVATDFRLWCREQNKQLQAAINQLISALLSSAKANQATILPGYTHLQRAQPVLFAHWCLAYVEMLKRDLQRLSDAQQRLNQCPLGCGALAGTAYPIDRHALAADLGFDSPCLNSLDAVSDRDFVLDLLFCASTSMMHLSRLAEDMIFFNSGEAGFVQLGDQVTSGSSLMPQKKNPDALELMRGKCGRVFGHLQGLLVTMKGLPLAYNKDMQEDKEGVMDAVEQWLACLFIGTEVLNSLQLNADKTLQSAQQGYANATELADYLVGKGVPFRTAHRIVGEVVVKAMGEQKAIEELDLTTLQSFHAAIEEDVFSALDIEALLAARNQLGGTGRDAVAKALQAELTHFNGAQQDA